MTASRRSGFSLRWHAVAIAFPAVLALFFWSDPALAQARLRCGPFTPDVLGKPEPREDARARKRFEQITRALKTEAYRVLFLGDSITERFDPASWREHMAPRGVLNAGINGDRTEHLRWRLEHGNLDGPPPQGVVVLIGTNDLGHGRTPEIAAEGIRLVVESLRQRLSDSRILLLGLLPRSASPEAHLRRAVGAVNRLIKNCDDGGAVRYADIGAVLLDPDGRLRRAISPDTLHFSPRGYARLAPRLDSLIDRDLNRR